jgi:hypothetical protein
VRQTANRALTLRQLIPRSILAGRWVAVLVCYLDDSGKDPQNRITTMAGFIAPEICWEAFELTVEPVFVEYGVEILHAKPLHDTDVPFDGWRTGKKRAFVTRICEKMQGLIPLGIAMSAVKGTYADEARKRKRTNTAYAKQANQDGVAFVLEGGT